MNYLSKPPAMLPRILSIPVLVTALWLFLADAPRPACGQASGDGTIVCCNQHVEVRGNWVGGDHKANCEDYARRNALARRQLCAMQCLKKQAKEQYCGKDKCKDNPASSGLIYTGVPDAKTHDQPSEDSKVVGSPFYAERLRYAAVKKVDGTSWYYVDRPPSRAGWISEDDVFCQEPPPPPPIPLDYSCKKDLKGSGKRYGGLFAQSPKGVSTRIYSEPTTDSKPS